MRIEILDEVSSTNEYIRRYLKDGENVVVCARRQTGGKGTKGRSFSSCEGGVYLSVLNFYRDFPAEHAFRIMTHSAVAVCRTACAFGVSPQIKWANDVYVNGKKLCGILIENGFGGGKVLWSITGIGVNVNNPLDGLENIAIGLSQAAGRTLSEDAVREELIANLQKSDSFDDYLSFVSFLGTEVTIVEGERSYRAVARRILEDGRLEVEERGSLRALSAAEIKLKLREGD